MGAFGSCKFGDVIARTGWLESARATSKDRFAGCSDRSTWYDSAMETAEAGSSDGGLDAAGLTSDGKRSTALMVSSSSVSGETGDVRDGVGDRPRGLSFTEAFCQVSNASNNGELMASAIEMETRDDKILGLRYVSKINKFVRHQGLIPRSVLGTCKIWRCLLRVDLEREIPFPYTTVKA